MVRKLAISILLAFPLISFSQEEEIDPEVLELWNSQIYYRIESNLQSVDCDARPYPIGCNYISNNNFSNTIGDWFDPFGVGDVPDWMAVSGSPNVNPWFAYNVLPLPPSAVNYVYMACSNTSYAGQTSEGIAQKIPPLVKDRQYLFSINLKLPYTLTFIPTSLDKLNVVLAHCSDADAIFKYPYYGIPTFPTTSQKILCQTNITNFNWEQLLVGFTAEDDFDMIVIYPETEQLPSLGSVIAIALPELIAVDDFKAVIVSSNCNSATFGVNCGITNATYTWEDPNNNVVSNTDQLTVSAAATGIFTVSMTVSPSSNTSNTCSDNSPVIQEAISTVATGSLQITSASAQYYHYDASTNTYDPFLYTQSLDVCASNHLCYNSNEYLKLTVYSNQSSGNHWQILSNDPNLLLNCYNGTTWSFDAYTQDFDGFAVVNPGGFGTIEVRLDNSVTNETKSIFIEVHPSNWGFAWCNSLDPNYEFRIIDYGGYNPNSTYAWTFPSGMIVSNPNVQTPNFSFGSYSGFFPANATVQITDNYCSSPQTSVVALHPGDPLCNARYSNQALLSDKEDIELKKYINGTKLFPNPTGSNFQIQSKKLIKEIDLYSLEGKFLKRFLYRDFSRELSIAEFTKGTYFIRVIFDDDTIETKIILKQ